MYFDFSIRLTHLFPKCSKFYLETSLIKKFQSQSLFYINRFPNELLLSFQFPLIYFNLFHFDNDRFWEIFSNHDIKFQRKKDLSGFLAIFTPHISHISAEKLMLILEFLVKSKFYKILKCEVNFSRNISLVFEIMNRLNLHFLDFDSEIWSVDPDEPKNYSRLSEKNPEDKLLRQFCLDNKRHIFLPFVGQFFRSLQMGLYQNDINPIHNAIKYAHLISPPETARFFFHLILDLDFLLNYEDPRQFKNLNNYFFKAFIFHKTLYAFVNEKGNQNSTVSQSEIKNHEAEKLIKSVGEDQEIKSKLATLQPRKRKDLIEFEVPTSLPHDFAELEYTIFFFWRYCYDVSFASSINKQSVSAVLIYLSQLHQNGQPNLEISDITKFFIKKHQTSIFSALHDHPFSLDELSSIFRLLLGYLRKYQILKPYWIIHMIFIASRSTCLRLLHHPRDPQTLEIVAQIQNHFDYFASYFAGFLKFLDSYQKNESLDDLKNRILDLEFSVCEKIYDFEY